MSSSKGKSKDIHLASIDVTFGSNRILFVPCSCRLLKCPYMLIHTTLESLLQYERSAHARPRKEIWSHRSKRYWKEYASAKHGATRGPDPFAHLRPLRRARDQRRRHHCPPVCPPSRCLASPPPHRRDQPHRPAQRPRHS
jgi:hypothetical protein